MNIDKVYEHPTHEPDERKRESMTFNKPFQTTVLEGATNGSHEQDLGMVVILSSN